MIEQTFPISDGRAVLVKIDKEDDSINFYFNEGKQWFYDVPFKGWVKRYPYWQEQLHFKYWFTEEMKTFIDLNAK